MENNNKYKEYGPLYLAKGYSVIPDKFRSKLPAIKGWSEYCDRLPTEEEVKDWSNNFTESNISLAMGEAGGVIAIDVDTEDQKLLEFIRENLYPSPYEKVGAKGFTRFYRYTSETTQMFKHNKDVLFELLSNGKKCTIPPSVHPTGSSYKWSGKSLLDVNPNELPVLPPANIYRIHDEIIKMLPPEDVTITGVSSFVTSGRNDELLKKCMSLIGQKKSLDDAVKELVRFDKETNSPPYFTDPQDQSHLDPYTNALSMYSYQLNRINTKHHRKNEEYETPQMASAINAEYNEAVIMGKSQGEKPQKEKKLKELELPHAHGVLGILQQNILENSWIKQPDMALSASLALISTLIGRKFIFGGLAPNLYVLNIAPSGSGKDAPQQCVKRYITTIGKDMLLGSGDYVSDASLMDSLAIKPARLDIFDEAGGILRTMTKGGADYNKKMADILCELYTSSNTKFLGRTTAEGTKGACDRPNVSILASTTPTGFSEGVSISALEKGLLGRFIVFFGRGDERAERLTKFPELDAETIKFLRELADFKPEVNLDVRVGGIEQLVHELKATNSANILLDTIFNEFDEMRINSKQDNAMLPIISRLYQQTAKIAMIHACGRDGKDAMIDDKDVKFGYDLIMYYFQNMTKAVANLVHVNHTEQMYSEVLDFIPKVGDEGITARELSIKTRYLGKRKRDELISELKETGEIVFDRITRNDQSCVVYWRTK